MLKSKRSGALLMIGILILLSSCATVKFYSDASLKNETGLRVYPPKPYLLVEFDGTKTVNLKTSLIYLPDKSDPQYIKVKPGLGTSAVKLDLNNGILTSYGLTTDSKVPETMAKITDLLTKSTASVSDLVRNKSMAEGSQPAFELYEIVISNGASRLIRVQ